MMPLHAAIILFAPAVTTNGLLKEMADLDRLAKPPDPPYVCSQASSYDRKSLSRTQDWFANGDAGQFLRVDGKERVMMDQKGPGALVRFWSANPSGVVRFYFDGETTPRFTADMAELLTGRDSRFPAPFAYTASNGCNLYFPFPYQKGLKVTLEGEFAERTYYQLQYRTYDQGASVETYMPGQGSGVAMAKAAAQIVNTDPKMSGNADRLSLEAGSEKSFTIAGPGTVQQFAVRLPNDGVERDWEDPRAIHNVLRRLSISIDFDGQRCVEAPLGDFFSTPVGMSPFKSIPISASSDGTMIMSFPMPFHEKAKFTIRNSNGFQVVLQHEERLKATAPADAYYFHVQYLPLAASTRPMADFTVLNTKGEGRFVGYGLHVANPVGDWWGEGDEKVFRDGESFPSTFGTGTEDYFGYAWSSGQVFDKPYHGMNHCDGPATLGHNTIHRWQIIDDLPYKSSLEFLMEMWHWREVNAEYNRTAYWYQKAGGTGPAKLKGVTSLKKFAIPAVKGAIEGEKLPIEVSGGVKQNQDGFASLSNGQQFWWTEVSVGQKAKITLPAQKAGKYRIKVNVCHAKDYGIHELSLNGKSLGKFDFYGEGVEWKVIDLGVVTLTDQPALLEVTCVGENPKAIPSRMFGLDYVLLEPQR